MKKLIDYINESLTPKCNAFCMLKPGFIDHDEEFQDKLKAKGWNILNHAEIQLTEPQAADFYSVHKDKDFYGDLCKYMSSGPSHWYSCYKDCNDPIADMGQFKDEIRKAWGKDDMKNAMHSSDSMENVGRELMICDCKNNK